MFVCYRMSQSSQDAYANLEIEMMTDLYNRFVSHYNEDAWNIIWCIVWYELRLSRGCHKKCIPPNYHEGELSKGEAVCLDRCVAKFLEVHDRIGKKLTNMYMQDQAVMKQMQGVQR